MHITFVLFTLIFIPNSLVTLFNLQTDNLNLETATRKFFTGRMSSLTPKHVLNH